MLPRSSSRYGPNCSVAHRELGGNSFLRGILSNSRPYLKHLFGGELCACRSAFRDHVVNIFVLRAKEKMRRVYATRTVSARAVVADIHIVRNGAIMQFPTDSVNSDSFGTTFTIAASANPSVSFFVQTCQPVPTLVRAALIYLFPKSIGKWARYIMAPDKSKRLTLDPSFFVLCFNRNGRGQATAAFAQLGACFVKGKLWLEQLWGMLGHVVSASNAFGQSQGRFHSSPGIFAWFTRSILAQVNE